MLYPSSLGWRDFQEGRTERTQSSINSFKSWTQGPDFSCQALAEGLKENSTLKNLDLKFNKIGAEGAKAFCSLKRHLVDFHDLCFGASCFCSHLSPCQALAEGLKENSTLINLNLEGTRIGDEGAKAWCLVRMV